MDDLIKQIITWGEKRDLDKSENAKSQTIKLMEEIGELAEGINKAEANLEYVDQIKDSIGDIQVVLIILSEQLGINYGDCLFEAYEVIKNRKGKTTDNGTFVKEEDLGND